MASVQIHGGSRRVPLRRTILVLSGVTAVGAAVGVSELLTGTFTPPVRDLEPLGLHSWVLPGLWLLASVGVPCSLTAWWAARDDPRAPGAAQVSALLLVVELVVQVPFVGLDPLQAVMGVVALALGGSGTRSRLLSRLPAPARTPGPVAR